jgi:hypothetical protein
MGLASIADEGTTALLGAVGETLTYSSTTYACIPAHIEAGNTVTVGGKEEDLTMAFAFRPSSTPTMGQKISYDSKTFRIHSVRYNADNSTVIALCTSPNS